MDNLGSQVFKIEQSLDKGVIELSLKDLTYEAKELEPSNPKTPFDSAIEEAFQFMNELKHSKLSDQATKDIVESDSKRECIKWYMDQNTTDEK